MNKQNSDWEATFRAKYAVQVSPDDEKDLKYASILEQFWQVHPIGDMINDISRLLETEREKQNEKWLKLVNIVFIPRISSEDLLQHVKFEINRIICPASKDITQSDESK